MKRLIKSSQRVNAASDWVEPGRFDKTFLAVAIGSYHHTVAVVVARDAEVAKRYFSRSTSVSTTWDSIHIQPFNEASYRRYLNETFSQSDKRTYTVDATEEVAKACGYPTPPQYDESAHQKSAAKFWDAVYLKLTHRGGPLYVTYVDYDEERRVNYWGSYKTVWPEGRFFLHGSIEEGMGYPRQELDTIMVSWDITTEIPASVEDGASFIMELLNEQLESKNLPPIPTNISASVTAANAPGYKNMQVPYESDAGPMDEGSWNDGIPENKKTGHVANINDKVKFEYYDGVHDEGVVIGLFTDGTGDLEVLSDGDGETYRVTPFQFMSIIQAGDVTASIVLDNYNAIVNIASEIIEPYKFELASWDNQSNNDKDIRLKISDGRYTETLEIDRTGYVSCTGEFDGRNNMCEEVEEAIAKFFGEEVDAAVNASTYDPDMDNGKGGFKFTIADKREELDSRIDWCMHHFDYDDRVNPECESYKGTSNAIDYANRFITEIQKGVTDSETVRNAVKWTEMAEQMIRKCIQEGEDLGYAEDGFIDDNGGTTEPFAGDW